MAQQIPICTVGGFTEASEATKDVQQICDQVKHQVEGKTNKKYKEFTAVQYKSQVVAGVSYLIKVHVGGQSYLHLKVLKNLPCNGGQVVLLSVEEKHGKEDSI